VILEEPLDLLNIGMKPYGKSLKYIYIYRNKKAPAHDEWMITN
jgi:hypothetical protein